jgi:hypothetical protein
MISQTAPEGEPHFVLTMAEHTEMCGQMASAFGNDRFEPPAPFEQVVYIVEITIAAGTRMMPIPASIRRPACPTSWRARRRRTP